MGITIEQGQRRGDDQRLGGAVDAIATTAALNHTTGPPAVGTKGRVIEEKGMLSPALKVDCKSVRRGCTVVNDAARCKSGSHCSETSINAPRRSLPQESRAARQVFTTDISGGSSKVNDKLEETVANGIGFFVVGPYVER